MMENKKYYIVRDINFARVLKWICGQNYMVFDSKFNKDEKVYSFENTEKFQEALAIAKEIKNKIK